ncbi:MAG: hypothetical protein LBO69_01465 [Ignavibacteria bacterium]|jgi:hypothetical protein|nr:hypothetical protein [Ignavibacteria bacterium]
MALPAEFEEKINQAVEDGLITREEWEEISKTAKSLGINRMNEVEMMLHARLNKKLKENK